MSSEFVIVAPLMGFILWTTIHLNEKLFKLQNLEIKTRFASMSMIENEEFHSNDETYGNEISEKRIGSVAVEDQSLKKSTPNYYDISKFYGEFFSASRKVLDGMHNIGLGDMHLLVPNLATQAMYGKMKGDQTHHFLKRENGYHSRDYHFSSLMGLALGMSQKYKHWGKEFKGRSEGFMLSDLPFSFGEIPDGFVSECTMHFLADDGCTPYNGYAVLLDVIGRVVGIVKFIASYGSSEEANVAMEQIQEELKDQLQSYLQDLLQNAQEEVFNAIPNVEDFENYLESELEKEIEKQTQKNISQVLSSTTNEIERAE